MPSDTVWVALIGGSVTVASLGVQGWLNRAAEKRRYELEDRQRSEDRAWSVRLQNHQDRRTLYARLLRSVSRVSQAAFFQLVSEDERTFDDAAKAALEELEREIVSAEVEAVDRTVLETTNQITDALRTIIYGVWMFGVADDNEKKKHLQTVGRIDRELLPRLRDACRRDLGYDSDVPPEPPREA